MHEIAEDVKCNCDQENCLCCDGCVCKHLGKETAAMDEFSVREKGVA